MIVRYPLLMVIDQHDIAAQLIIEFAVLQQLKLLVSPSSKVSN